MEGFAINEDPQRGAVFIPTGPWREEFGDEMRRRGLAALTLSYAAGFQQSSVSFLADLRFLSALAISSVAVRDLSPVLGLPRLTYLSIGYQARGAFDVGRLQHLANLGCAWFPGLTGIERLRKLRSLTLTSWPHVNLEALATLSELRSLTLESRKLRSLRGLRAFRSLQDLCVRFCPLLDEFDEIGGCATLVELEISGCKRLESVGFVRGLPLRRISIESDGEVASLEPLVHCPDLEEIVVDGDTRIVDGRIAMLATLQKLKRFVLRPRRHYDASWRDVLAGRKTR